MNYFINPLLEIREYNDILKSLKNYTLPVNITGPSDSQKSHISYAICEHLGLKGIFLAFNEMHARKVFEDFSLFYGDDVLFFPARELMLHDVEAKSYDAVFQRVKVLNRIIKGNYKFIVTSAEAMSQKLITREIFTANIQTFLSGERLDLTDLQHKLVMMGYERVSLVEGKGQFAIRGGIIDIFSVDSDFPYRIELFDDEVDSIRTFDIITQRSVEKLEAVEIIPAREVLYPAGNKESVIQNINADLKQYLKKIDNKNNQDFEIFIRTKIEGDIEKIKNHSYFPGVDRYIPYIIDNPSDISHYASDAIVFIDELSRFEQRIDNILLEHQEACKGMMEKGHLLPKSLEIFFDYNDLISKLSHVKTVYLNTMNAANDKSEPSLSYNVPSKSIGSYQGHIDLAISDIKMWKEKSSRLMVLAGTRGRGERLVDTLNDRGIECTYAEDPDTDIMPGQVVVARGSLNKGFEYSSIGFVVVSDKELFGQARKLKKQSRKREGIKIKAFTDLSTGDYVVHQAHGIGQYVGIEKLVVENIKRDYLKIRYQDDGYLYIPTTQMELIQKYIGSEGNIPKLNKLGGSDWAKTKKKVKESLRELAGELIKLYAQRQSVRGYAFQEDTVWQRQLEELFPYEETEDQLKCISEIKEDMESEKPMDRLLCGDVGYGKTEVAIRAVFKAIMGGKQVAYLVPTTILAQQQYSNFKERMKDFPVTVEVISRFRTQSEQKKILKEVKAGNVDVLVGTHRLIQKDIQFKDLGLLVVDEEQRFGVSHKEKLKNIKPNVDVLTLTATPIPRTLHMSMVGIRDISVIEDPPEERYPVQTYVMEYNTDVVRDAIYRELGRKGQVFYLYNRVRSIDLKAEEIQSLVPDAKLAVAHGQMDEKQLEDIMYSFINGDYDILVCTTIIESGLDMPNVNTIIVEDADKMGLSQLYQLRGRVGRSNRVAYAYITYKKDKILSEIAEKRLQAIKEFTEFGSGFKIAMRDLEIRGAGNLLGPEQHGHMESVGYDMYCKLLDEAVRELKGESLHEDEAEVSIDLNVSAYIDDSYISAENQKIEMYKKIASIQDEQDALDVQDELIDRFGDLPVSVSNLIRIATIKTLAKGCGFVSIQEKGEMVTLQYADSAHVKLEILGKLMEKYKRKLMFTASSTPYITFKTNGIGREDILSNITVLLQDINSLQ